MQAQFPCILHNDQELTQLCLHPGCANQKLCCDHCLPMHDSHKRIPFEEYRKIYKEFNQLSLITYKSVKNAFKELSNIIDLCLRRSQERVIKEFCGNFTPEAFPTLKAVELQQFYGITQQALSNPILIEMLKGKPAGAVSTQLNKYQENLQNKIIQMQSEIVVSINKFASESQYYMSEFKKKENFADQFFFSKHLKNNFLKVHGDGKILMRPSIEADGLSVYGLVDKPLTADNSKIGFKIMNQKQRFIYFGACYLQEFQKNKYMGPVYELGNGMFGIRQHYKAGSSAVALHHSIQQFSNEEIVGWDFGLGDKLVLEYLENRNELIFSCNDSQTFRMKISNDGVKRPLYPFVGMKHEGQQVMILSRKQCNELALKKINKPGFNNIGEYGNIKSKLQFFKRY